ncbi:hypothetical protein A2793_02580 [candidate division WWE3 bacterium RIFCSPHIGHO2_01_FULL_38_45]|nr:MAG: hypothetical protein A2793_02580 [candidate division WWE3 bacterium RIFCSPHIGHO2_01_FULL_38_45]
MTNPLQKIKSKKLALKEIPFRSKGGNFCWSSPQKITSFGSRTEANKNKAADTFEVGYKGLDGNIQAKQGGTTRHFLKASSLPKLSVRAMNKVHSPFSLARVELIYIRFGDDGVFCF